MKRTFLLFIKDIEKAILNIESFVSGIIEEQFLKDEMRQSAIIRQLEIIGEAVKNLPEEFRKKYSSVEWKKIAGLRDILIHAYFGADISTVWKVVKDDLPKLKKNIEEIIKKETLKEKNEKKR